LIQFSREGVSRLWPASVNGNPVWNVHNERGSEGSKGSVKRRPRGEWVILRDTRQALVSDAIAETLLANLDAAVKATREKFARMHRADRVELDPNAATLQVCYRIQWRSGFNVASPGGFEPSRAAHEIRGLQ